ncbi:MAG: hypothetical protein K2N14_00765 [Clostridia bacterium]|nr:hypothetical protein [Clostridia bacterium]
MITKKCAQSFIGFAVTMLICYITMYLMSFFTLSKWVGVSIGVGVFAVMLILALVFRKNKLLPFIIIPINSIGDGLALSSLYVYLGAYPAIWETAVLFGALLLAMLLYCILTNVPYFRNHFIISMITYCVAIIVILITVTVVGVSENYPPQIFYLAFMSLIPFIAFFISLAIKADSTVTHVRNMSRCSFAALIVILIVVIIIISQGDGLDGLGDGIGGGADGTTAARRKRNPYDFTTFDI